MKDKKAKITGPKKIKLLKELAETAKELGLNVDEPSDSIAPKVAKNSHRGGIEETCVRFKIYYETPPYGSTSYFFDRYNLGRLHKFIKSHKSEVPEKMFNLINDAWTEFQFATYYETKTILNRLNTKLSNMNH